MASFGAKYPRFARIKTEPDGALPTYEGAVTIGRMIKGDLAVTFASGKLYADDQLAESVDEFVSGAITLETDDILDDVAGEIYGATAEDGLVDYKAGDAPPFGGLVYYKALMRKGVKLFKGFYYPRVKAQLGNDTAQTKGDPLIPGNWNADSYRAVELEAVPSEIVSGYWYYSGEFFTTPEKEAEFAAVLAQEDAVRVSSITFVTLAESGQIDDITITENAVQFRQWDQYFTGKAGTIVRDEGKLYKNIHNIGAGQNTNPSETPSQWTQIGDPGEERPEWIPPIGAHDAYDFGAKVTHKGKHWVSTASANVWEPGVYGWTEQK